MIINKTNNFDNVKRSKLMNFIEVWKARKTGKEILIRHFWNPRIKANDTQKIQVGDNSFKELIKVLNEEEIMSDNWEIEKKKVIKRVEAKIADYVTLEFGKNLIESIVLDIPYDINLKPDMKVIVEYEVEE
jgi:hypothetical protein